MSGYACVSEGCPNPVSWLVTHMNPAGTFALCDDDFPVMVIHVLATELGTDPEKLYDAIKRHVDREAARQAKANEKAAAAAADSALAGPDEPPDRCQACGRVPGMPTAPCESCPDYDQVEDS